MWSRHLVYRKESLKTTWTLRLALVGVPFLVILMTRGIWIPWIGHSVTCTDQVHAADAILIENFDVDYLPFERAAALQSQGLSSRVFVPIDVGPNGQAARVADGIVELMTRIASLKNWRTIPIHQVEPISLNAAKEVSDFLAKERIHSVIVVAPGFRSRRSSLVYNAVLKPAGITVSCVPTTESKTAETWTETWHGIQEVTLQFLKLQYYRFYVLPKQAWS